MAEGLTQNGWVEPKRERTCGDCDRDYIVEGVVDIREDEGLCRDCEREIELDELEEEL